MNNKSFISHMYDATHAIASVKCSTRTGVIFNRAVIVAMFNFL
jgi:uncharacterized protein YjhX (UPF0386 family)